MLANLDEKLAIFCISSEEFNNNIKRWIFHHIWQAIGKLRPGDRRQSWLAILREEASKEMTLCNCYFLTWSVREMDFDETVLIWHIATELCYSRDHDERQGKWGEEVTPCKMSKLVSRYMLYLLLLHPSMLPTGIGVLRYRDTLVDIRKFFEGKPWGMSKDEGRVSSVVVKWAKKLFKKERHFHTGVKSCETGHKTRKSRDLCELCHLLLQMRIDRREAAMCRGKSRSVLYDACLLASQLDHVPEKWDMISMVWAKLLMYAACQCGGYEHCESLSRGGELLSHIWLLMAHLGFAEVVQTSGPQCAAKLIKF